MLFERYLARTVPSIIFGFLRNLTYNHVNLVYWDVDIINDRFLPNEKSKVFLETFNKGRCINLES